MNNLYKSSNRLLNTNNIVSGDTNTLVNNAIKDYDPLEHEQLNYIPLILALQQKTNNINTQTHRFKNIDKNARTHNIHNTKYNRLFNKNNKNKHTARILYLDGIKPNTAYTNTNTLREQTDIDNLNTIINSDNTSNLQNNNNNNNNNNTNNNNLANKYKIITYIGQGINGKLYMAHDKKNNKVVCKQISIKDKDIDKTLNNTQQIQYELQILKYLANNITTRTYINPCLDHKIINNNVYTFFPIFNGYSLIHFKKYLSKLPPLTYYNLIFYLIKLILHGMAQIHKSNISHQNLTENSILISSTHMHPQSRTINTALSPSKLHIKFTDFGLGCGNIKDNNNTTNNNVNTQNTSHLASCASHNNVPIIINNNIKSQLTDTSYLQLSQQFDIFALGIIFLKLLLYHFENIDIDISKGYNNNIKNILFTIINKYINIKPRNKTYIKHTTNSNNTNTRKYVNETQNPFAKLNSIETVKRKQLIYNIKNYLNIFLKYMFCNTNDRHPLHYILDKLIIYEKYNN